MVLFHLQNYSQHQNDPRTVYHTVSRGFLLTGNLRSSKESVFVTLCTSTRMPLASALREECDMLMVFLKTSGLPIRPRWTVRRHCDMP